MQGKGTGDCSFILRQIIEKIVEFDEKLFITFMDLEKALKDPELSVVESAVVALSNIEFMEKLSKNEKFAKLTGG